MKYPTEINRDNSICVFEENINDNSFNQNSSSVAQDLLPVFSSVTIDYINDLRVLDQDQKRTETKLLSTMTSLDTPQKIEQTRAMSKQEKEDDMRKDPEEEYFRLAVLALKVLYNEKDNDFVFEVSPGKLYKKAKRNKIPFHQYYIWIENQLKLCNEKLNPVLHRE
jgi:hypothetical protein